MINETITTQETCYQTHHFKHISWTAIFVGALTAVGLGFLLNLFGIAIGLSAIKSINDGSSAIAIGGLLGIIIGIVASMFAAGYATGYLARLHCPEHHHHLGILYGFTTWVVALILSAAVIGHFSHYVATYTNTLSHSVITTPTPTTNPDNTVVATTQSTTPAQDVNKTIAKIDASSTATLASGSFVVFVLFFIGAFFTCVGACCGMGCCRKHL